MKTIDFKNLLKKENPKRIIFLYTVDKIKLSDHQLDEVIKMKNLYTSKKI